MRSAISPLSADAHTGRRLHDKGTVKEGMRAARRRRRRARLDQKARHAPDCTAAEGAPIAFPARPLWRAPIAQSGAAWPRAWQAAARRGAGAPCPPAAVPAARGGAGAGCCRLCSVYNPAAGAGAP